MRLVGAFLLTLVATHLCPGTPNSRNTVLAPTFVKLSLKSQFQLFLVRQVNLILFPNTPDLMQNRLEDKLRRLLNQTIMLELCVK
jgi:hypothetical protein